MSLERHPEDWVNVSRDFRRENIPYERLENSCDARQGQGHNYFPTEDECGIMHLLDASRGGDPTCPHRPPVPISECACTPNNVSGGVVGCALSHTRAWNRSYHAYTDTPFQLVSEDDTMLQTGVARSAVLEAVANASALSGGNWSLVFFSPSRDECLPDCAPGLRQWGVGHESVADEFDTWFANTMAADAWTSMYALSRRGRDAYLARAESEGFGVGVDKAMYNWCEVGECFTLYSGDGPPPSGALSQAFENGHNSIENGPDRTILERLQNMPLWTLITAPLLSFGLLALWIWACLSSCSKPPADDKAAPLAGK